MSTKYKHKYDKSIKTSNYAHRVILQNLGLSIKGKVVHHKDHDISNNSLDNLEIISSHSEHMKKHYHEDTINGIPRMQLENIKRMTPVDCYTLDGQFVKSYPSAKATEKDGFLQGNVSKCIRGERSQHKGYKFMPGKEVV